jgi:hypothetical protein
MTALWHPPHGSRRPARGRRWRRTALGLVLPALVAATAMPAGAQNLSEACRWLQTPTIGEWASYRLTADGRDDSTTVRIAIVGRAGVNGVEHLWQEAVMRAGSMRTVVQSLVPAAPYDPTTIRRAIVQAPGRDPVELSPQALAMMPSGSQGTGGVDACRRGRPEGWETISVPAGTFRALHVRYERDGRTADSWLVPTVPFALARSLITGAGGPTDTIELVLLDRGLDATPTLPLPAAKQP